MRILRPLLFAVALAIPITCGYPAIPVLGATNAAPEMEERLSSTGADAQLASVEPQEERSRGMA